MIKQRSRKLLRTRKNLKDINIFEEENKIIENKASLLVNKSDSDSD